MRGFFWDQSWLEETPPTGFYRTQVSRPVRSMGRVSVSEWVSPTPFWNLTDVTLADEDTNSILTDKVNRRIQGNMWQCKCNQCKWRHQVTSLPKFEGCPPGWVTCIATLPWITLLTLSVSIKLVSLSARVTSVKFQKGLGLTHNSTHRSDQVERPGSDKNLGTMRIGKLKIVAVFFYRTQVSLVRSMGRFSLTTRPFWNLTDVTLADEDTKSILTDNANRAIQDNVAMHVTHPVNLVKFWTNASSAILWQNRTLRAAAGAGQPTQLPRRCMWFMLHKSCGASVSQIKHWNVNSLRSWFR